MILSSLLALAADVADPRPRELDFHCKAVTVEGQPFAFSGAQRAGKVLLSGTEGTPLEGFVYNKIDNGLPGTLIFSGHVQDEAFLIDVSLEPWSSQTPQVDIYRYGGVHQTRKPISVATGFCRGREDGKETTGEAAKVKWP